MNTGSGLYSDTPIQPRFTQGGGVKGEIGELRRDLKALELAAAITVVEYTDPLAAGAATLHAAAATVAAEVVYASGDLLQPALLDLANAPRQVVFTTGGATPAHAPANAVVEGVDAQGKDLTETVALAQTATTATTVNAFAHIESITLEPGDGTSATIAIGTAAPIGLPATPKERAGLAAPVLEIEAGAVVTTGALSDAATVGPYGGYTPGTPADGSNDYAVYYEFDPTSV